VQQARNLALSPGERSGDIRFLIRDRGPDFTRPFTAVFLATGARILRTAVQALRDLRTPRRHPAPRAPRPRADPRRGTPAHRPGRIPAALQHGPRRTRASPSARPRRRTCRSPRRRDRHRHTTDPPEPILNGLINEYTHAAWRTEDLQVTQPNPIFERDRFYSAALFGQTAQLIAGSHVHLISGRGHITVTRDRSFTPAVAAFFT
jgi:hypothetical protein